MFIADDKNIIVAGTNKLIVKEAIKFQQGNKIVGALDGYYDLNELDPNLHEMAINILSKQYMTLLLPNI